MIIFGWGSRRRQHPLDQANQIILTYRIVHLLWLFTIAFKFRYSLATSTESGWAVRDISEEEAAAMCGGTAPKPAFWWRWSLLAFPAVGVLSAVIGLIAALFGG